MCRYWVPGSPLPPTTTVGETFYAKSSQFNLQQLCRKSIDEIFMGLVNFLSPKKREDQTGMFAAGLLSTPDEDPFNQSEQYYLNLFKICANLNSSSSNGDFNKTQLDYLKIKYFAQLSATIALTEPSSPLLTIVTPAGASEGSTSKFNQSQACSIVGDEHRHEQTMCEIILSHPIYH